METKSKILTIAELAREVCTARSNNKIVVHCHGVFDLLHIGHIRYFEHAKRMGDLLVVTITPDKYVDKGPRRPAFTETLRAEAVASLNCVDYVGINEWPTAEETLRVLRPDVYVKGSEFRDITSDITGKIGREEQVIREIGAQLAFTDDIVFSSSSLINRFLSDFPEEIDEYLNLFRQRFTLQEVLDTIEGMASLNVLVLGDAILDEYQYCEAMGKSSKDPVLAMKFQSCELFAGGVLAVANHAANFAGHVDLVTVLGEQDSHEDFIRERLCTNISPHFIVQPNAPTIIKRRFLDSYTLNKLFEVYVIDGTGLPKEQDLICCDMLRERLPGYDVVIAADFGHGAISQQLADCLSDHAHFLCVNTQANAGNRGFHTVTKYKKAEYVCIAEHEIRLEMRDLSGQVKPMMSLLAERLHCKNLVVTRGRRGCVVRAADGKFIEVPAFAQKVVDRVGAGDAFLSATSLAAAQAVPEEVLGFIGNIVGCLAVEVVGNKKPIDKLSAKKYITAVMK